MHVAAFKDPLQEMDKLHELYDSLTRSAPRGRRGGGAVPQVRRSREDAGREAEVRAAPEVAFRVAVKDGKVNFTARGTEGRAGVT